MKEINIADTLVKKRKEKMVTQEDLARHMGVSKASVSKWETNQSYPDITLLPQLATFFNISLDELMNYSPQMSKEDIKRLYHKLSKDFSNKKFENVIENCREIIKKYYSCTPLLLQMVILLINHHMLADKASLREEILEEVIELCKRIKVESNDVSVSKQANSLEALAQLMLQRPIEVLELLDGNIKPECNDYSLLANAYQMLGKVTQAKEVLQISSYQNLLGLLSDTQQLLLQFVNEPDRFEMIKERFIKVSKAFEVEKLQPNIMAQFYLALARGYAMQQNIEEAIQTLKEYADLCINKFFPIKLEGDKYFDLLDTWFKEFDLGKEPPREEKVIKDSMVKAITQNPYFKILEKDKRFIAITNKMKENLGGN